jgi:hypothetical protein
MDYQEAWQLAGQNPLCLKLDAAITLSDNAKRFPHIHHRGVPATDSNKLLDIYYEVFYRFVLSYLPNVGEYIRYTDGRERETASLDEIDDIRNQLEGWIMCCGTIHVTPFCYNCGSRLH